MHTSDSGVGSNSQHATAGEEVRPARIAAIMKQAGFAFQGDGRLHPLRLVAVDRSTGLETERHANDGDNFTSVDGALTGRRNRTQMTSQSTGDVAGHISKLRGSRRGARTAS